MRRLLVAGLLAVPTALAGDARLDLESLWKPEAGTFVEEAALPLDPLLPDGYLAPPVLKDAAFALVPLGDESVLVAVQGISLWVDRNRDRSLRDETPLEAELVGESRQRTLELPLEQPDDPLPFVLRVDVTWQPGARPAVLRWRPRLSRAGVLETGDHARAFLVLDGNGDLRFDSVRADRLVLDVDANGRLEQGPWSRESFAPGAVLLLGDRFWRVEPSGPRGWWVRLRAAGPPEGEPVPRPGPHDALLRAGTGVGVPDDVRERARTLGHAPGRAEMDAAARALVDAVAERPALPLDLRAAAARWLAFRGDAASVRAALELAQEFPDAAREDLALQLSTLRTDDGVAALVDVLDDAQVGRRRLAFDALRGNPMAAVDRALYGRLGTETDRELRSRLADATHDRVPPARLEEARAAVRGAEDLRARIDAARALVRIGLDRPAVRDAVLGLLADRAESEETRICLLDEILSGSDPRVVEAVAACLSDRDRAVRIAAAQALGRLRTTASIPPLVAALAGEDDVRVRLAVGDALYALTGQQMLDFEQHWREWWERFGGSFRVARQPPRPRPRAVGERRSVATFYGVPILSERVVFLIDRSVSMSRRDTDEGYSRLQAAVKEVLTAAEKMPRGTEINVIAFGDEIWTWRRRLTSLSATLRRQLERDLTGLEPAGGTWLYEGLEAAFADPRVETVFVLSDGEPSGGRWTDPDDICRELAVLNKRARATVHTIAVGTASPLLERIAREHGGTFVRR